TYGCAADHGLTVEPMRLDAAGAATSSTLPKDDADATSASTCAAASACAAEAAPSSTPSGSSTSPGSSSHANCSSIEYAALFSTRLQLSIAPVGHGGTQAMHPWQTSGLTT